MARLDIVNLVKRYGDFYAVRDVTLGVADGVEIAIALGQALEVELGHQTTRASLT